MRPYPEELLKALAAGIGAHFMPEVTSRYAQAQFAFGQILYTLVQRDYDSAAQDLVDSSRALRELLADASIALSRIEANTSPSIRARVAALPPPADSIRLSALRAENEALRQIVCDLVPVIEPAADLAQLEAMRDVRDRLYAYLKADAQRRSVPILGA
jgi:hypothetical protein